MRPWLSSAPAAWAKSGRLAAPRRPRDRHQNSSRRLIAVTEKWLDHLVVMPLSSAWNAADPVIQFGGLLVRQRPLAPLRQRPMPVHIPAHVFDAVGGRHGSVHAGLLGGTHTSGPIDHNQAIHRVGIAGAPTCRTPRLHPPIQNGGAHLVRFRRVLIATEATAGGDREEFSPLELAQVCAAMAF